MRRRWLVRWGPVVLYTLLILAVSSIPRLSPPGTWSGSDKIAHLIEYAILGFLIHRAFGTNGVWSLVVAAGIVSVIGGIDEIYQSTVPGRFPSLYDWLADTGGGAFGAALRSVLDSRRIAGMHKREQGIE